MPWHDPPLRAINTDVLADGTHDGVRWWLQRFDGVPALLVTLSGFDGGSYLVKQAELVEADPTSLQSWLERTLTEKRATRERQAAKRQAPLPPVINASPLQVVNLRRVKMIPST